MFGLRDQTCISYISYIGSQILYHCCCCCWVASVVSDSVRPHRQQPIGSSIPEILQARTLEWVAISFSNEEKWKVKVKSLSHVWLFVTPWTAAYQASPSMGFSMQEHWSGLPLPSPLYHCTNWETPIGKPTLSISTWLKNLVYSMRIHSGNAATKYQHMYVVYTNNPLDKISRLAMNYI